MLDIAISVNQIVFDPCGIVSLVNVVDPEVVVIGGGIARAGNALFELITKMRPIAS